MPFRRTFESEKQQLRELNGRLLQYLSRTKQLEQENAHLAAEISELRRAEAAQREPRYGGELRELRRAVGRLSLEKSRAEMERERLGRELRALRSLCGEQREARGDVGGELRACETELRLLHEGNGELRRRLLQLEEEYKRLEEARREEVERLRLEAHSRLAPAAASPRRRGGPPAASAEEVQEFARCLSEGWMESMEAYQRQVEEMERSVDADRAALGELQRERVLYASELDRLRAEAERQGHVQGLLEQELAHMQEKFRVEYGEYQVRGEKSRCLHV